MSWKISDACAQVDHQYCGAVCFSKGTLVQQWKHQRTVMYLLPTLILALGSHHPLTVYPTPFICSNRK